MPSKAKLEADYKEHVIDELEDMFPGCLILKNDEQLQQGIPDRLLLWGPYWAFLEIKRDRAARKQPNQDYFIELAADWSFGAFIYPENEEEVFNALQQAFRPRRTPQRPKP